MIHLQEDSNFAVIPKFDVQMPIIEVFDEFLETTVNLTYSSIENESGYLVVNYTFNPIKDRQYYITIKENNITAWQGKGIGTI